MSMRDTSAQVPDEIMSEALNGLQARFKSSYDEDDIQTILTEVVGGVLEESLPGDYRVGQLRELGPSTHTVY